MAHKLYGDGIHDDTLAIQEMLDSGNVLIKLPVPERYYLISKTLKIHSYQELVLSRWSEIRLAPRSDCPMLANSSPEEGNECIAVRGGIWNFDNLNQAPNPQMENVKKIFTLFADEKTYPVYFHCQGGGDRTGTIAFLLESVLGVSDDDMLTDYEMSNLSVSGERIRYSEVWTKFMEKLATFAPGKSHAEQSAAFLLQCGITAENVEKIKDILLV